MDVPRAREAVTYSWVITDSAMPRVIRAIRGK